MTDEKIIERLVAAKQSEIAALDDRLVGEVVGVAQAVDQLRTALDEIDACLARRELEAASALGYGSVSESFVFLQRALGGLHSLCLDKDRIIQTVADESGCAFEAISPTRRRGAGFGAAARMRGPLGRAALPVLYGPDQGLDRTSG